MQSEDTQKDKLKIGILIFPNVLTLDFIGPYDVLSLAPNTEIFLVSKTKGPIKTKGIELIANNSFSECPQVDIILVPGGSGINDVLEDEEYINFLTNQGKGAKYITSVCTGALLLAAAGLLEGYKATTHWASLPVLKAFGIETVKERVVIDRNRITGGGVTAGIDFGLRLVSEIFGPKKAKQIQLHIEYNPDPPFNCGSPETADKEVLEEMQKSLEKVIKERLEKVEKIKQRKEKKDSNIL